MPRLYNQIFKAGASAYDWRTRKPTQWHPEPVGDVEKLCRRNLDRALDSWGMYFRDTEFDDTLAELIALVWKLESRFDPDKGQSFSAYASWMVSQRSVDFGPRRVLGRHGTRIHQYMASEDYEGSRMGEALDRFALDSEDDRHADVNGLLRERSESLDRRSSELGFGPDGQSALGDT